MSDPVDEYKSFVDGLVAIRESVEARTIRQGRWPYGRVDDEDKSRISKLLTELTQSQRDVVAQLVQQARKGGIHDVLVFMTDQHYRLSRNGVELSHEPFGTEAFYDSVARAAGRSWPPEADPGPGW